MTEVDRYMLTIDCLFYRLDGPSSSKRKHPETLFSLATFTMKFWCIVL